MNQPPNAPGQARPDDQHDLSAEARVLRRKVIFWRRIAWLLVWIVVLVSVVAWQRTNVRRRECRQSLEHYAKLAVERNLRGEPAEVMEAHWQQLPKDAVNLSANHYALIVQNWLREPEPGESLPLAVCRDSHPAIYGRSRHVLQRTTDGTRITWLSDEEAAPIVARIRQGKQ